MDTLEKLQKFIAKYTPSGIIIDTNILIVFLVGSYDCNYIQDCKIVNNTYKKYTATDYELLKKIFSMFKKIIVTPQIMAEVSNISITQGIKGDRHMLYLAKVIEFIKKSEEHHQKHECLLNVDIEILGKFGFTDLTMFELAKQTKMPILTDERELFDFARDKVPIIKYEYIKYEGVQTLLNQPLSN